MKLNLCLLLIVISFVGLAQDKIIKITSDTINCKVSEILSGEIKYYYSDNSKIVFGIDITLVDRIEFGTGEIIKIDGNSFDNRDYYTNQHHRALKFNFLSPLLGSSEFIYEQNIKPGKSWEAAIGIIGLGFDSYGLNPRGVYGKFAYKFLRTPTYYSQKMHYSHILKGGYIAPEFALRYAAFDDYYYDWYSGSESKRNEEYAFALTLKFGKQWVFDNSFIVDSFFGIGYGFGVNDYETIHYGFVSMDEEFPMAFTSGIRIGWAF